MIMVMMIMMIHVYNTKVMNLSQAYCRHCTLLVWTQNLEIIIYHSDFMSNFVSIIIIMNPQELSNLAILLLLDFF